jgi:hypothetical protein
MVAKKKVDKVTRYGWLEADDLGDLCLLSKRDLNVDNRYQRERKHPKVLAIARGWSWPACGVLIVAVREDGRYWVVDGGHRWAAAMERSDITHLP